MATVSNNPLKILLLGDSLTGKNAYVNRLLNEEETAPSNGHHKPIQKTQMKISHLTIELLTIAGVQKGKTAIRQHYTNIDGLLVMFDVTNPESFDSILSWRNELQRVEPIDKIPAVLIANKCDLEADQDVQNYLTHIDSYCEATGFIGCFQTSVKNKQNIAESMQRLCQEIQKRRGVPNPPTPAIAPKKEEYLLKIVVIGEKFVGKTALIQRCVKKPFTPNYLATIGCDLDYRIIKYNNSTTIRLQLWDIAGEERFSNITKLFYRDAVGCLLAFDVTNPISLTDGAVKWKNDLDQKAFTEDGNEVPCLLLGNKCDLPKHDVVANKTFMDNFCQDHRFLRCFETSAKSGLNVENALKYLIDHIMQRRDSISSFRRSSQDSTIKVHEEYMKTVFKCCQ